ncbi:MAG TPA: RNA polymerase sigma factor [Gaiellaceae bacterium]|nr:RNA polymerase sigma factor [Gaiellaceae bacterium]
MSGSVGGVAGTAEESELVGRLREGDERAFEEAVDALYPAMFAVARGYVRVRSVAEEVVQDGWVAILDGLERFEGRSSLRTWVLQIVANIARDRGAREGRSLPFSALEVSEEEPLVEPERFLRRGEPFPGGWKVFPTDWRTLPESRVLARETRDVVDAAITSLPDSQRLVMMLRDVVGCRAEEVSEALGITAANERVLLHRARVRVRAELERYFDG